MGTTGKSKITVTFDPDWISERAKAGIRVVRLLEAAVRGDGRFRVCNSTRTGLTLETDESARTDLLARFAETLATKAGEDGKSPWAHAAFRGDLAGLDVPRTVMRAVPSAPPPPPDGGDRAKTPPPKPLRRPAPGTNEEIPPDPDAERAETVEETLRNLCGEPPLLFQPELSDRLREIAAAVPRLQALGAMEHFWRQHLLVSIDDGWGFGAFRNSLLGLYRALGLAPRDRRRECREIRVVPSLGDDPYGGWRKAVDAAESLAESAKKGASAPLLCLDVSAWQEKLGEPRVKDFLRRINDAATSFTCVFRVTFLEPGVLRRVEGELDDVINVRSAAVPSAPMDDMVAYVRRSLAKSGFHVEDGADPAVEAWILREMSDGSFFGFKTLDKIASRIVYGRALSAPPDAEPDAVRAVGAADLRAVSGASDAAEDPDAALARLVGMEGVKKTLEEIVAQLAARRDLTRKGRRMKPPAIHMAFSGAPGTGKTTVARIAANLLKKAGLLRKGHLVEVRGRDLCGEYVGQTAPKTSAICRRAAGSVLFIDEAYSLFRGEEESGRDYGREAIDTLVAEMENHRDDFCVILAGYPDEMSVMLGGNAGLGSRVPHRIEFPNYTRDELGEIFLRMVEDGGLTQERGFAKAAKDFFRRIPDETLAARDFGNARLVRNLYERAWGKAAYRRSLSGEAELKLLVADLAAAAADPEFKSLFEAKGARRPLGFAPAPA